MKDKEKRKKNGALAIPVISDSKLALILSLIVLVLICFSILENYLGYTELFACSNRSKCNRSLSF